MEKACHVIGNAVPNSKERLEIEVTSSPDGYFLALLKLEESPWDEGSRGLELLETQLRRRPDLVADLGEESGLVVHQLADVVPYRHDFDRLLI